MQDGNGFYGYREITLLFRTRFILIDNVQRFGKPEMFVLVVICVSKAGPERSKTNRIMLEIKLDPCQKRHVPQKDLIRNVWRWCNKSTICFLLWKCTSNNDITNKTNCEWKKRQLKGFVVERQELVQRSKSSTITLVENLLLLFPQM